MLVETWCYNLAKQRKWMEQSNKKYIKMTSNLEMNEDIFSRLLDPNEKYVQNKH